MSTVDVRLRPASWDPATDERRRRRSRALALLALPLVAWYLLWLLDPSRVGHPVLYVLLVMAELFNVTQAIGFWWTTTAAPVASRVLPPSPAGPQPRVDVFIPTYSEPLEVVEPTVRAAARTTAADVRVWVLDDGDRTEFAAMAERLGVGYLRRDEHTGAKAGNINHALPRTDAPYVAVLDCDHVPTPDFLARTLPAFVDERLAYVQTPQHYANAGANPLAAAAWAQQALFFGPIAVGKARHGAMFCCGTNVVFRREALEEVGGFPEGSLTEDFSLSIELHERGWRSEYVPEVLANGLGPEDAASYVSQQHRWARGCLGALPRVLRSSLPWRQRVHYALSSVYFLSGWTMLIYLSLPIVRLLTGAQPVAGANADAFLVHFAPYFGFALLLVAVVGAGRYTFGAFCLAFANFWIHVHATTDALLGRSGSFVVTPKHGQQGPQPRVVAPALVAIGALVAAAAVGLSRGIGPAVLNNVAFVAVHVSVLLIGCWPALRPASGRTDPEVPGHREGAEPAGAPTPTLAPADA